MDAYNASRVESRPFHSQRWTVKEGQYRKISRMARRVLKIADSKSELSASPARPVAPSETR